MDFSGEHMNEFMNDHRCIHAELIKISLRCNKRKRKHPERRNGALKENDDNSLSKGRFCGYFKVLWLLQRSITCKVQRNLELSSFLFFFAGKFSNNYWIQLEQSQNLYLLVPQSVLMNLSY